MKYRFIHWIRTPNWEGAMIENPDGKRYYTSGICKWPVTPERQRKVVIVPEIDTDAFMRRWREYRPYDTLTLF